ncbi:hypothetical protein COV19_03485 [Candidatus Woesearchaeota archaeon CG10_big_fil_rev_8_21_14_0_10_44_13]|nr:MAG: hypothetical protein COV19_03485 [Candidatus Woesearchaeota archaeon CG10_big_fil_rev_8_21_14_0_10_44_13]
MIKTLMVLKQWVIRKYGEEPQPEIEDLVWLKKVVKAGEKIDWAFVDTADYYIDSIPRKRELVLEFRAKHKEVAEKCQNLLN